MKVTIDDVKVVLIGEVGRIVNEGGYFARSAAFAGPEILKTTTMEELRGVLLKYNFVGDEEEADSWVLNLLMEENK
jgi:hypothetical protein